MISIKSFLKLVVIVFSVTTIYSQQDAQYTQYMYNMNVLNPAYAGSQGTLSLSFLGRSQWVGIDGAPQTFTASVNSPIRKNIGLGFSVIADNIGPLKEQNVYADFSYTIPLSNNSNLALGLKGGVTFLNANLPFLNLGDDEYDEVFAEKIDTTSPNFGAGLFYYTDNFYFGLSMPNMLKTLHFNTKNGYIYEAVEEMHYFVTAGYVFDVSNTLKLKPSTMIKAVQGAPVSIDLSANALINEKMEFGLSWRSDDSISGMLNFKVSPSTRIGYAYDYSTSNIGGYSAGSHEIMLLFNISNSRYGLSPRFF